MGCAAVHCKILAQKRSLIWSNLSLLIIQTYSKMREYECVTLKSKVYGPMGFVILEVKNILLLVTIIDCDGK